MSETAPLIPLESPVHGEVLMERETDEGRVCLIYWGKNEVPKLTVVVEGEHPYILHGENEERTTELYYHPFSTTASMMPIANIKGTYV